MALLISLYVVFGYSFLSGEHLKNVLIVLASFAVSSAIILGKKERPIKDGRINVKFIALDMIAYLLPLPALYYAFDDLNSAPTAALILLTGLGLWQFTIKIKNIGGKSVQRCQ